jgi:IclR family acetate operon transcriptional repressor
VLSQDERTRPSGSQAIERAAQLLVLVLEQDRPTTLGELARLSDLPKSTASRLIAALERNALVQRDSARGAIRPGPAVLRFAGRGVDDATLVDLAQPVLHALARESGETINLAVPATTGVNHLAQIDSRHMIGAASSWVGRSAPFHAGANGKVFLASGTAELPRMPLTRFTPHTITDRAHLDGALDTIRAVGYATAVDEIEVGLSAVAVPVRGASGACVAALSISGPSFRLDASRLDRLGALLIDQAAVLSTRLGYPTLERGT